MREDMRMWVFRVPKADGGDPDSICPVELNQDALTTGLTGHSHPITDYSDALDFVLNEIFDHDRLRQGWGVPTLDLRLSEQAWIENYIIASSRYWGEATSCENASGRRRILIRLVQMERRDVIFLPSVGRASLDDTCFSVCRVSNVYFFEDRSQHPNTWEKDFAHVIPIEGLQTFEYGRETLERSIFGAPYLHAIDEVQYTFESHNKIQTFAYNNQFLS